MTEAVWVSAKVDPGVVDGQDVWSPALEHNGWTGPLPVGFTTEEECDDFIRDVVLGATSEAPCYHTGSWVDLNNAAVQGSYCYRCGLIRPLGIHE